MGKAVWLTTGMMLWATGAEAAVPAVMDGRLLGMAAVSRDEPSPEKQFSSDRLCVRDDSVHGWRPCRGDARDALSYLEFYRLAERNDLADADESRWYRRQLLITAGIVAIVAGTITVVPRLLGKSSPPWWVSGGVLGGGVGLCVWGAAISQEPLIDAADAGDMADSFNRGLRKRLGVPAPGGGRIAVGIGYQRAF